MGRKLSFGMQFDFRNPPQYRQPWDRLYAETLEFVQWIEKLGFDYACMSEHHFAGDGYLPSPLVAGAAVAARTSRIRITTAIALAPFYHPVRIAEDCAVLDIISGGRMELGLGLGYKPDEFTGYGVSPKERGTRLTEMLQIIRRLWDGETLSFRGTHYQIDNARLAPRPLQAHPTLWVGGANPAALKRAALHGDGIFGGGDMALRYPEYVKELAAAGKPASAARMIQGNVTWMLVSNDPQKTAREVAPHVLHSVNTYSQWNAATKHPLYGGGRQLSVDELIAHGPLKVLTPEQCIAMLEKTAAAAPIEGVYGMIPPAGYPLSKLAGHVELFATKVMPHFR
jgi:alkanesulfonate monooxygenase SsuD/methylene tetrahydromethanopterin reductase-like flavin-dependent oxidoreductase (luciferase family)